MKVAAARCLTTPIVEYFLAVRDANEIPPANRADVAMLIRDGYLSILPDATLRPANHFRVHARFIQSRVFWKRGICFNFRKEHGTTNR